MGNTKGSGRKPKPKLPKPNNASTDWKEIEYKECSEDWRNRDRLIWATLPVAATVAAVIISVAFNTTLWIRLCILVIGVFLAFVMLISLIKHRFFQQGSEKQIRWLQVQLNIEAWESPRIHRPFYFRPLGIIPIKKIDAALTSWASQRSGFKWMFGGTLVVMLILAGLAILTMVQGILN